MNLKTRYQFIWNPIFLCRAMNNCNLILNNEKENHVKVKGETEKHIFKKRFKEKNKNVSWMVLKYLCKVNIFMVIMKKRIFEYTKYFTERSIKKFLKEWYFNIYFWLNIWYIQTQKNQLFCSVWLKNYYFNEKKKRFFFRCRGIICFLFYKYLIFSFKII